MTPPLHRSLPPLLLVLLTLGIVQLTRAQTVEPPSANSPAAGRTGEKDLASALQAAQQRSDLESITRIVALAREALGDRLAEPETPVRFTQLPSDARPLTAAELGRAFASTLQDIEQRKFWRVGLDPTQLHEFPRGAASVVIGCLAARRAGCDEGDKLLATAREAGDFLLWTQAQGGAGNFPFPARRGGGEGVWGITERALRKAEAQGRLDQVVRNGWAVDDRGLGDEGGLQIENANGGVAALHLYEATREERYLHAAVSGAEWAAARPCVPNWNYNSFSVWLLAEVHRVTGERRWLETAKEKARLGIYPGQLTEGSRAGRWFDPHNAKPNYHYILLRAVACLVAQLPADDPDREAALACLRSGFKAWNPVFAKEGLPNLSSAAEALAFAVLRLPDAEQVLAGTAAVEALDVLERACGTMVRAGKRPADPSAWGMLLEVIARRLSAKASDATGGVFKKFDRNGDGKLDASEAGTLAFFQPADRNGDGFVTREEANAHAGSSANSTDREPTTGTEGDSAAPVFHWPVAPVKIPESECPVMRIDAKATEGRPVAAWWRQPKGEGPFPAILFIHGGLTQFPEASLRRHLTDNPVITRFLAAGYAVVMATFRTYEQDVQSRGPIEDVRAVLRETAKLPGVAPRRTALYGGSGGGSIALELGGDPEVRAIVAGEPATVLYTGMLTTGEYGPRLEIMADPEKYFTPELRQRTWEKLKSVRAPVLILHGDQHDLHKLNKPLFLPLMKEAGVEVEYREYAGYGHGFYFGGGDDRWGKGADEAVVERVVKEVRAFLDQAMADGDRRAGKRHRLPARPGSSYPI
jgi:acetyl esterase/lipase